MARPGKGLGHRAAGSDSPGVSPRSSPLEALSRRLNAEVEQLRAENARLQVCGWIEATTREFDASSVVALVSELALYLLDQHC